MIFYFDGKNQPPTCRHWVVFRGVRLQETSCLQLSSDKGLSMWDGIRHRISPPRIDWIGNSDFVLPTAFNSKGMRLRSLLSKICHMFLVILLKEGDRLSSNSCYTPKVSHVWICATGRSHAIPGISTETYETHQQNEKEPSPISIISVMWFLPSRMS